MIILGFFLLIIGLIGIVSGMKKNNIKLQNISIAIMVISLIIIAIPLFLLRGV